MGRLPYIILSAFSVASLAALFFSGSDIVSTLSPQGCRMSWMSPSYVLQANFDLSWSPLARRYSLWLYREVGWDSANLHGSPVLFIPGNAGSSHQVRSIASSATRQWFSTPYQIADEFRDSSLKPLDLFAVEFNEDLSAFHGTTLQAQGQYVSRAIDYILSLYPSGTSITLLGHSMGGVVATSILPHPNISAIVTMSTPHTLPPARFDRRIDSIYTSNLKVLLHDSTPILSLCGGATDTMVPSESCVLPVPGTESIYRRAIFTSALEGAWTGVGHKEMVWCHQVRWRIARAAIELGGAHTPNQRGVVLDTWLRDGHMLPPGVVSEPRPREFKEGDYEILPQDSRLVLREPRQSKTYLLPEPSDPISNNTTRKFVLYLSQGSITPTAPHHPLPLRATVYSCQQASSPLQCSRLNPDMLRLIPNPYPGRPFPVAKEGSDESDGVVLFEGSLPAGHSIAIRVQGADGRGWIVGGYQYDERVIDHFGTIGSSLLFSTISVNILEDTLRTDISLPNAISSGLLVYRLTPVFKATCSDSLLSPLLLHQSSPSEAHYFPLRSLSAILLHTHSSGPYLSPATRGLNLSVYSSGECAVERVSITVDWWATLGRWGVRYWSALVSWAIALILLVVFNAWRVMDATGSLPPVGASLGNMINSQLPWIGVATFLVSFLPIPPSTWLGNSGEPLFSLLAPFIILIDAGLVCVSWVILKICLWLCSYLAKYRRNPQETSTFALGRSSIFSLALVCLLIFLFVPWQVAFLGCWIYHFWTCAASTVHPLHPPHLSSTANVPIPLTPVTPESTSSSASDEMEPLQGGQPSTTLTPSRTQLAHRIQMKTSNEYLLFLMTWLMPLVAPVLAVWVRTLMTAGYTTPFDGDHNFLYVLPFLILVEAGPLSAGFLAQSPSSGLLSPKIVLVPAIVLAFVVAPRSTYVLFELASISLGIVVMWRVGFPLVARWR